MEKPKKVNRDRRVTIPLTPEELNLLLQRAEKQEIAPATCARIILMTGLRQQREEEAQQTK